jgi:hypothetical protein
MKLRHILCSALLMSGLGSTAWARDVCLAFSGNTYIVLRKVKSLRPGVSVPLNGFYYYPGVYTAPVDGSAVMKADGTVLAGLFVHALAEGSNNYTLEWKTDATFAGLIKYDNDGDFSSNGGMMFNAIDCKTVPLP